MNGDINRIREKIINWW